MDVLRSVAMRNRATCEHGCDLSPSAIVRVVNMDVLRSLALRNRVSCENRRLRPATAAAIVRLVNMDNRHRRNRSSRGRLPSDAAAVCES
mmetsp:Transcript_25784/g.77446  ORF Transcript_25784/g.77446 Transcript_25784/m.77446 type:complete len:90 (+) Transcript_25784:498-767(+)